MSTSLLSTAPPFGVTANRVALNAAFTAGTLWILHYALQLGYGLAAGKVLFDAEGTLFFHLDRVAFFGAYLSTGIALVSLATRRDLGGKILRGFAGFFALVGALSGFIGLASGSAQGAGKGILGLFLAAILIGISSFRLPVSARRVALPVLLFGLLTMPLAFALGTLEHTVPSYTVTELHFVVFGVLCGAIGTALRFNPRRIV